MAAGLATPDLANKSAGSLPLRNQLGVWQAPLVPLALAATAGIIADRYLGISFVFSMIAAIAGLFGWAATRLAPQSSLPLIYLWLASAALGAAYHHWRYDVFAADDIGNHATTEPRPVKLRGLLVEEPAGCWRQHDDPLRSIPLRPLLPPTLEEHERAEQDDGWSLVLRPDSTHAVLEVNRWYQDGKWLPVSGRVRLTVAGELKNLHAGDAVEITGRLATPQGPQNPGEKDYAASLRGKGIRAVVSVRKTTDAVTLTDRGWPLSLRGILGVVRGWGERVLQHEPLQGQSGLASALVLGEGVGMTEGDWEKFRRTGVVWVLVISGQHLFALAAFLWWIPRLLGVQRRRAAAFVFLFLLGYALLTGARPPAIRATVIVGVAAGGIILGRPVQFANSLALAWIVVGLLNPSDLATTGCQLSFLSVALLYWGTPRWFAPSADPLERLIEESRPRWVGFLLEIGRKITLACAATLVIWLGTLPLVAAQFHLVAPVAILIGLPVMLLTSTALITGFLILLTTLICWPLAPLFALLTCWLLRAAEWLVDLGDRVPGGHWYADGVPIWWLWGFYIGLFAFLTIEWLRSHWRWVLLAGLAWLCLGLLADSIRPTTGELRCTFLAVGHGGCVVLETPDGRTLLYDAGSVSGPEVTTRQIAPFLWSRGIRRIDEVILSHGDLDHFNGLSALAERFAIAQVTCTPSFFDRATPGLQHTLRKLRQARVPIRVVHEGIQMAVGEVRMEVLHPPKRGPEGNENARSLVLLICHAGHTILLTGDLEGPGLAMLCRQPPRLVDVLMAPHHGSRFTNTPELADWARPRVVIACQGRPRSPVKHANPYTARDPATRYLGTWPHGAITVRSGRDGLSVETFVTQQLIQLRAN